MKRILEIDNAAFLLPDGEDAEAAARVLRRSLCITEMHRKDGGGHTRIDMTVARQPRVCVTAIAAGVEFHVQDGRETPNVQLRCDSAAPGGPDGH